MFDAIFHYVVEQMRLLMKNRILFFSILFLVGIITGQAKDKGSWKDLYNSVGDIKIHYLDSGAGDTTLVFIPGWTMPAEVWENQIVYFSSRKFRVIAVDPRSQGLTTKTDSGNTYQQHAADLNLLLKNLKIDHFCLIGWGAGVTTVLEYVSSPETYKPESIVLAGGSPALLKNDDFPGSTSLQQLRKLFEGLQDKRSKATEKYVRSLFKDTPQESLVKDLTESSVRVPMSAAISLLFDQLTGDRRSALIHISVPTLIISNSDNRAIGEYFKSKIANANFQLIEGTGDSIFVEKPQAFNQALESFLETARSLSGN
jgi:non-heme chloroperoxidase